MKHILFFILVSLQVDMYSQIKADKLNTTEAILKGDDTLNVCEQLLRKVDDLTGIVTLVTNDFDNADNYEFIKTITKKGKVSYMLHLSTKGLTQTLKGKGVAVMFSDLSQFKKPNISIDVAVKDDLNYEYSAYIPLTLTELNLFIKKPIKKYRLYIYDQDVESYRADLVACLKTTK
jgi:hypothetical protein